MDKYWDNWVNLVILTFLLVMKDLITVITSWVNMIDQFMIRWNWIIMWRLMDWIQRLAKGCRKEWEMIWERAISIKLLFRNIECIQRINRKYKRRVRLEIHKLLLVIISRDNKYLNRIRVFIIFYYLLIDKNYTQSLNFRDQLQKKQL
jgi:hypothetical protein